MPAAETHYDPEKWRLAQEGMYGWDDMPARYVTLKVPVAVALGHFEKLTHAELLELRDDIHAEIARRNTRCA